MLSRCGHGITYTQIEEINTALCLQKMASTPDNDVPLPKNIQATVAWDNIDRTEETLSGAGRSHRVNVIAVQAKHFGPGTSFRSSGTEQARTRKRNIDPPVISLVPPYNAGDRTTRRRHEIDDVDARRKLDQSL